MIVLRNAVVWDGGITVSSLMGSSVVAVIVKGKKWWWCCHCNIGEGYATTCPISNGFAAGEGKIVSHSCSNGLATGEGKTASCSCSNGEEKAKPRRIFIPMEWWRRGYHVS